MEMKFGKIRLLISNKKPDESYIDGTPYVWGFVGVCFLIDFVIYAVFVADDPIKFIGFGIIGAVIGGPIVYWLGR